MYYAAHPALGAYVNPFSYGGSFVGMRGAGDSSPAAGIGAPEGNVAGSINLGGLELTGRLSAAFLGAIVLALVAFNIVTKGIQF